MKATCNSQCRALITVGFVIGTDKIRGLPAIGKDHARVRSILAGSMSYRTIFHLNYQRKMYLMHDFNFLQRSLGISMTDTTQETTRLIVEI